MNNLFLKNPFFLSPSFLFARVFHLLVHHYTTSIYMKSPVERVIYVAKISRTKA